MVSDIKLLEAVKAFLDANMDTDKVASTTLYAPQPSTKTPYCVLVATGSSAEILETDGGGDDTTEIDLIVVTEKYGFGTAEERKSLVQLYQAVDEIRRLVESPDYLKAVKNAFDPTLSNTRLDSMSREYGIINTGEMELHTCTITTPFIIYRNRQAL